MHQTTISLSPLAAEEFQKILAEEGKEGWALRFGHHIDEFGETEYLLDYSEKPQVDDVVFESHGLQIHVEKNSAQALKGCVIDFSVGCHGAGFKIINPNEKKSCGGSCDCGKSKCC